MRTPPSDYDESQKISIGSVGLRLSGRAETVILSVATGLVGLATILASSTMRFGTIDRMGPGYFPLAVGILLILTAFGIAASELRGASAADDQSVRGGWDIRGLVAIPVAVVAFGLLLPQFGLIVACAVAVWVGRLALPSNTVSGTIVLTLLLPLVILLIFVVGLDLPLLILPA